MNPHKALRVVMAVYGFLYAAFALIVLFAESRVYALLDLQQQLLGIGAPSGGAPPVSLWKYVALGLIVILSCISFWAARDPVRHRVGVQLMIYNKFVSGLLMIAHFAAAGAVTAFLVGGLSDLAMGAVAWVVLERAFPGSTAAIVRLQPLVG